MALAGHVEPTTAPTLPYMADPTPPVITEPKPVAPRAKPIPAPRPLSAKVAVKHTQRIGLVRAKGLTMRFTLTRAAILRAELRLSPATARKLGLPRIIGAVRPRVGRSGTVTVRLRLTRRASAALRHLSRLNATLITSTIGVDGHETTATTTVSLKR